MKRLSLSPANLTIALFIFMAASVVPSYSQEVRSRAAPAAEGASEQGSEDLRQGIPKSAAEVTSSPQAKSSQTGAKQTTSQPFIFPTKSERFNRYVKSTVGLSSFAGSAITAGIDQWRDHPEEWQQGAAGYARRYASDFGRNAIQQTVIYGLDSALGLDTRFRRSTRKGFFPRLTDALAENITSRTRTGKRVISVPRLSGIYAGEIIQAEAWFPARFSYKDGLRSGNRSLAAGFAINLLREFVIRF